MDYGNSANKEIGRNLIWGAILCWSLVAIFPLAGFVFYRLTSLKNFIVLFLWSSAFGGVVTSLFLPSVLFRIRVKEGVVQHVFCQHTVLSEGRIENLVSLWIGCGFFVVIF